jgi:hypothetical protein
MKRIILSLLVLASFLIVGRFLSDWRGPTLQKWAQVCIGDTEEQVLSTLGNPIKCITAQNASDVYYVEGYRKKSRSITSKVLIYMERDLIFYIWIGRDDRVEDTFIGTS